MITATSLIAMILVVALICHLLFKTGPVEWIDSQNTTDDWEKKALQNMGPIIPVRDPEVKRDTALLPNRTPSSIRDTVPCSAPNVPEPTVIIDDHLLQSIMHIQETYNVTASEAALRLLHQAQCAVDCGGHFYDEGKLYCECGTIPKLVAEHNLHL